MRSPDIGLAVERRGFASLEAGDLKGKRIATATGTTAHQPGKALLESSTLAAIAISDSPMAARQLLAALV